MNCLCCIQSTLLQFVTHKRGASSRTLLKLFVWSSLFCHFHPSYVLITKICLGWYIQGVIYIESCCGKVSTTHFFKDFPKYTLAYKKVVKIKETSLCLFAKNVFIHLLLELALFFWSAAILIQNSSVFDRGNMGFCLKSCLCYERDFELLMTTF